mgnify:CR=1 FL=1|jgi:ribosomal-protein-alanine N-acetyltransferase
MPYSPRNDDASAGRRAAPRPLSVRDLLSRIAPTAPAPVTMSDPWTVRTPRLLLRPLAPSDRSAFLEMLRASRGHLARFFPLGAEDESDTDVFDRHMRLTWFAGPRAPDWRRAAFDREGRLIGGFNLNGIQRGLVFRAEANWWVRADMTGRGLATEGVRAMLELAFRDLDRGGLGLHRVDALVCPENEASLRIVRRLGFVAARGTDEELVIGGERRRHVRYTRWVDVPQPEPVEAKLPVRFRERLRQQVAILERATPAMVCA